MTLTGVGVKCLDDEINEQRILRAPAITLSDHRAVYDAKCGRLQGVLVKQGHLGTEGGGKRFWGGRSLWTTPWHY